MRELFEKNKRLVGYVYQKHFREYFYLREDLLQEGFLALYMASKKFECEKGNFSGYAYRAIKNRMLGYLRQEKKYYNFVVNEVDYNLFGDKGAIQVASDGGTFNDFIENAEIHNVFERILPRDNKKKEDIVKDWVETGSMTAVAHKNAVTVQYVSAVIKKFKNEFVQEYERV